jgi:hypothetical protein
VSPLSTPAGDAIIASSQPEDWRKGAPPDYHLSNEVMPKQRTCTFAEASLEATRGRALMGSPVSRVDLIGPLGFFV